MDIDRMRMIIHDDNPNQRFFVGGAGSEVEAGGGGGIQLSFGH